ncbi:MAG TPA: ABC transporter ATP-binding protein [Smithella sp.]|nr:MAG: Lipopolysaccharide export system ATP-binding protein LptB [Deltaproteobacteria bacterium ADurb.Bin022]HOS14098.1 ABC transporter ATP-binding protein [Smithella sp.]HPL47880.1 ABC transporter ATP-binding protein [Smithella sp.]HQC18788.1 ABC transporter ATP-binding protein [Smithella sp.]
MMLRLSNITQIFGGLNALEDVSFSVKEGSITGIIGPNGAGKTTLFNIVTGLYTQTGGDVFLGGENISFLETEELAGRGLVRTFQNVELFRKMTVLENVMVGLHTKSSSGIFSCAFKLPRQIREEKAIREKSMVWLKYTGIAELAEMTAGNLPFGKGRLLEISRALAAGPKIILMDEPAAGLNSRETAELALLIRKIRQSGVTVVLVEHDMDLVMDVCDAIVVLNLGKKLAEGTPREIQENPAVISAYLGEG